MAYPPCAQMPPAPRVPISPSVPAAPRPLTALAAPAAHGPRAVHSDPRAVHHARPAATLHLVCGPSGAPRVSAPSRPHRGYVTRRDAAVHGPRAPPWSSAYGLAAPLAHALATSPPSSDVLRAWPASCVVLFRRAPTRPAARAPPHAPVLVCTRSPLHHLLGFSSAKYSPTPLPSSPALLSGGTRLQPSRRSLWPRRCPLLRPSRYVTCALTHPAALAPLHAPVLACTRSLPHCLHRPSHRPALSTQHDASISHAIRNSQRATRLSLLPGPGCRTHARPAGSPRFPGHTSPAHGPNDARTDLRAHPTSFAPTPAPITAPSQMARASGGSSATHCARVTPSPCGPSLGLDATCHGLRATSHDPCTHGSRAACVPGPDHQATCPDWCAFATPGAHLLAGACHAAPCGPCIPALAPQPCLSTASATTPPASPMVSTASVAPTVLSVTPCAHLTSCCTCRRLHLLGRQPC